MASLFLTEEQRKTLDELLVQWDTAMQARDTFVEEELDIEEMEKTITLAEIENPNPFHSDDEEEEEENQYFSLDTSEKANKFRMLCTWANKALRSAKILRQANAKRYQISQSREKSLLGELKPPECTETEKIPSLTLDQLADDQIVYEFVCSIKKYRFLWYKVLRNQQKHLKSGFEFEQNLLLKIASLSISKAAPLISSHLVRSYHGAHREISILKTKLELLQSLFEDKQSPSRIFLSTNMWQMYINFVEKDPKSLDVITTTPSNKSCTLFDFKVFLLYREAQSCISSSASLITKSINYLKRRLCPSNPKEWSYLPPGIISKLLSLHLGWISDAGYHLNSKDIWISAIKLHIITKNFEVAKQLLTVVQYLPIENVTEILNTANDSSFKKEYPSLSFSTTIPSIQQAAVKRRQSFGKQIQKVTLRDYNDLSKIFDFWKTECDKVFSYEQRVPSEQKKAYWDLGIDPICFMYQQGLIYFSQFANQLEFATVFFQLYYERLNYLLKFSVSQYPEKYKQNLLMNLKSLMELLCNFSVFPNSLEISSKLLELVVNIFHCLIHLVQPKSSFTNSSSCIHLVCSLLCSNTKLHVTPNGNRLWKLLSEIISESNVNQYQIIQDTFNSISLSIIEALEKNSSTDLVSHAVKLFQSWASIECKFKQYCNAMKCFETGLKLKQLSNKWSLWKNYIEFCKERGNLNNVRVVFCRALCEISNSDSIIAFKEFYKFEKTMGGNELITIDSLFQLAQQKIGDIKQLEKGICDKLKEMDLNTIPTQAINSELPSKIDAPELTNIGTLNLKESETSSSAVNIDDSQNKKRKLPPSIDEPPLKKQKPNDKISEDNDKLNETLVKALVHPSNPNDDSSLRALEQLQMKLLKHKKLQNLSKTDSTSKSKPSQLTHGEQNHSETSKSKNTRNINDTEKLKTPGKTQLLPISDNRHPEHHTYTQPLPPPPSLEQVYTPNQQHYYNPPPQYQFPINLNHIPQANGRPYIPYTPNTQPQRAPDINPEELKAILDDKQVLATVRELQRNQVLHENDYVKRKTSLLLYHKEEETKAIRIHEQRLKSTRTTREYKQCQAENAYNLQNLKRVFQQQLQELDESIQREKDEKFIEQQLTLERVGIPGFFPTLEPKVVDMQTKILKLLFGIASDDRNGRY